jgi:acyl dehydratase
MGTTIELVAHNWATKSDNKIHDDVVAARFGFRGGLVPGVTLYGYLTTAVLASEGLGWLSAGTCSVRFASPVYEGDHVRAALGDDGSLALSNADGVACATGTIGGPVQPRPLRPAVDVAAAPSTASRPPADSMSLVPGTVLGAISSTSSRAVVQHYLRAVGIEDDLCGPNGLVHPAWLLLDANDVLVANVRLGPWIHVGREVSLYEPVRIDAVLDVHATVVEHFEKSGHRFTVLDVVTFADDAAVQRVRHTAIYQPRGA